MEILDFIQISTLVLIFFLLYRYCNLQNILTFFRVNNCGKEHFSNNIDTSCRSLPILCPPGTLCPQGSIAPAPGPVPNK